MQRILAVHVSQDSAQMIELLIASGIENGTSVSIPIKGDNPTPIEARFVDVDDSPTRIGKTTEGDLIAIILGKPELRAERRATIIISSTSR
ncbi:TPA: hypothetical protein DDX46_00070 [Candidatus Saccharibacteria bacterium]|nr:MAG: hypothetical protein UW38_C0001G0798 [Candidatus Saccharibacteria bacterium GW2011_GWC2_44_17]MBH1957040.1 hypothetical protein [Candidatus Saccharibacteria bacterium]MBH1973172.1 hypothetical protein [Candidatus Saccharibacteria bacterium]MBH1990587.1 hypothetical protein [Candidatus Saccharibacteria bacterium]HBH77132.1 hypothetical protein [Candidatus Saccharibacteria bacterium]